MSEDPLTRLTTLPHRLETDPETVQRDLMRLVLTIVELVRQLMEKQALRRLDTGDLTDEQVERVYRDIDQKRRSTQYLHQPPVLIEDVPEIHV